MRPSNASHASRASSPDPSEAIIQAWINECGGPLPLVVAQEAQLHKEGKQIEIDPESRDETSKVFHKAGLTEFEHIAWRETETRSSLVAEYWKILKAINSDFDTRDEIPATNKSPLKIPTTTRKQLEIAIAEQYVNRLTKPSQGSEFTPIEEKTPRQNHRNPASSEISEKGPKLTHEHLDEQEMTGTQVVDHFIKTQLNGITNEEEKAKLLSGLGQAAWRALKGEKPGPLNHPIRISKNEGANWRNIAAVSKGPGGQIGGNKYKLIKPFNQPRIQSGHA